MLWNAGEINGYGISASDGKIGTISDFLFDDTNWLVRWLVVDTGSWLSGRKVLLPSSALAHLDADKQECSIKLTMRQVKDSPDLDTERPVSRQMERESYDYYGYSPSWDSGYGLMGGIGYMGGYGYMGGVGGAIPMTPEARRHEKESADAQRSRDDVHLRSAAAVSRYHIHASDGEIGHVETFIIEDADWSVRYVVVDTRNWWPGKRVLISPLSIQDINWSDSMVNLTADRRRVKGSPAYDSAITIDREYDEKFLTHYGINPVNA